MRRNAAVLGLTTLLLSGCFHQVVHTGAPPGPRVVERGWVNTWIFGLVAADVIDTTADCPGGVATIETKQSFMNGFVGLLTLGIYTPQAVTITCSGGADDADGFTIASTATSAEAEAVAQRALERARTSGSPVVLRLVQ